MVTRTPLWKFAEQTPSGSQAQTKSKTATAQAQPMIITSLKPAGPQVQAPAQAQSQALAQAQMLPLAPAQHHRPGAAYSPQPRGGGGGARRMPSESLDEERLWDFKESKASLIAKQARC